MSLTAIEIEETSEKIARESVFQYFFGKKPIETEHILLKHIYPEDYKIRSSIGGLETSLGTRLWESLAKELAVRNDYALHDEKNCILQPVKRIEPIWKLMDQWNTTRNIPNNPRPLIEYEKELEDLIKGISTKVSYKRLSKGEGVDVFVSKKSKKYAFDIKTVQWNAGTGPKFNTTLIKWKTFHRLQSGQTGLNAHFVIPYDPTPRGWWVEFGSRAYPLDKSDIMVGDEFWDLLTGSNNSLVSIEKGFAKLATSKFMQICKDLLTNHSDALDIKLIEVAREVKFTSTYPRSAINRGKKWDWECMNCHTRFKSTIRAFKTRIDLCPGFAKH